MPTSPLVPPLPFDLAASQALARSLDALALVSTGLVRAEAARAEGPTCDWQGYTRAWFDERHAACLQELNRAGRAATEAADDVRRAEQTALARQRVEAVEAAAERLRAEAAELERLAGLGALAAGSRP